MRLPGSVEKEVANLSEGDFFGEVSTITRGENSASIVAKTKAQALVLVRDEIHCIRISNAKIYYKISLAIALTVIDRLHAIYLQF